MDIRTIQKNEPVDKWLTILTDKNPTCTGLILGALKTMYRSKEVLEMLNSPAYKQMVYKFDYLGGTNIRQVETYMAVNIGRGYGGMSLLIQDMGDIGELTTVLKLTDMPNNHLIPVLQILKMSELKCLTVSYEDGLRITGKDEKGLKSLMDICNSIKESYKADQPVFKRAYSA